MTADDWREFAVMLGGASAALTGLLFVAVSLNVERIAAHPGLRARAAETLVLFLTPLIWSAALLVPRQSRQALGAELTAIAVIAGIVLFSLSRQQRTLPGDSAVITQFLNRSAPNLVTTSVLAIGGILVCVRWYSGLYVAVWPLIVAILSGVITAWHFLLPLGPPADSSPGGAG